MLILKGLEVVPFTLTVAVGEEYMADIQDNMGAGMPRRRRVAKRKVQFTLSNTFSASVDNKMNGVLRRLALATTFIVLMVLSRASLLRIKLAWSRGIMRWRTESIRSARIFVNNFRSQLRREIGL